MPVKILTPDDITSGKATDSFLGQITLNDVNTMKGDFNTWIKGALPNSGPIKAKVGWYITKAQLDGLFNLDQDAVLLEITCAIQLEQNCICDNESMKGDITVILETKKDRDEQTSEGQFVLIPCYNDFPGAPAGQAAAPANCCPSSKPPGA